MEGVGTLPGTVLAADIVEVAAGAGPGDPAREADDGPAGAQVGG
jgi:hypothetical protein